MKSGQSLSIFQRLFLPGAWEPPGQCVIWASPAAIAYLCACEGAQTGLYHTIKGTLLQHRDDMLVHTVLSLKERLTYNFITEASQSNPHLLERLPCCPSCNI